MNSFDPVGFGLFVAVVIGIAVWYFRKRPQDKAKVKQAIQDLKDKL